MSNTIDKMRIDKWLWAARFYKTRSLAAAEVERKRVQVNDQYAKPARDVKVGDKITLQQGGGINAIQVTVNIEILSMVRGPASVAKTLYTETQESIKAREAIRDKKRFMQEPAATIKQGRPTKRDRRQLSKLGDSSSIDDEIF